MSPVPPRPAPRRNRRWSEEAERTTELCALEIDDMRCPEPGERRE
jgi:hypothetical protein